MSLLDESSRKTWDLPCPDRSARGAFTLLSGTNENPKMETMINESSCATYNPQLQSLLFTILPPELRLSIFEIATAPYDDASHQYVEADYYYRPGYHARHVTDTALLLTCRRAWLEANSLPMRQAAMTFWFGRNKRSLRPSWVNERSLQQGDVQQATDYGYEEARLFRTLQSLTPKNVEDLRHVRLFVTVTWLGRSAYFAAQWPDEMDILELSRVNPGGKCSLEYLLRLNGVIGKMQWPPTVTLTIPCKGWESWRNNGAPDMFNDTWLPRLLSDPYFQRVKILRLELECLEQHGPHVGEIIEDLKRKYCTVDSWRINSKSGREVMAWIGSPKPSSFYPARDAMPPDPRKVTYKVFELTWHNEARE